MGESNTMSCFGPSGDKRAAGAHRQFYVGNVHTAQYRVVEEEDCIWSTLLRPLHQRKRKRVTKICSSAQSYRRGRESILSVTQSHTHIQPERMTDIQTDARQDIYREGERGNKRDE